MFKQQKLIRKAICAALSAGIYSAATFADTLPSLWDTAPIPPSSLKADQHPSLSASLRYVPLHPVYFEPDKAILNREGQRALDAAVEYLSSQNDITRIIVEGSTDSVGRKSYNNGLSDRRAEIVRSYLTIKGIDPNLIALIGYGEYRPVDENWTREGRLRNRQVAIYAVRQAK